MGMPTRQLCLGLLVAWVGVGVVAAYRHWSAIEAPESNAPGFEEIPTSPTVRARMDRLKWSISQRDRVAKAVIREEMTLWEAAACFRFLDTVRFPGSPPSYSIFPGESDEERSCRQVIRFVSVALRDEPREDDLVSRLECELEAQLWVGDVRLPTIPSGLAASLAPR